MADKFLSTEVFQDLAQSICKSIFKFYKLHKKNASSANSSPLIQAHGAYHSKNSCNTE